MKMKCTRSPTAAETWGGVYTRPAVPPTVTVCVATPAPLPLAVADGGAVVRAVAVFVPVAAGVVAAIEEEAVPLILIAVSLNI